MGRILSAKDKAFQEERLRLMKEAEKWRQMVIERDAQLANAEIKIAALEGTIVRLNEEIEDHFHMTPEQFDEHIHKDMRGVEAVEFLKAMTGRMPFGAY